MRSLRRKALESLAANLLAVGRSRGDIWYSEGLKFECTQCGACCSGGSGTVEFTHDEARGMAGVLGLTYEQFMERYAVRLGATWTLSEVVNHEGEYDCVLLARDPETGMTRCTVHRERPMQCRTWPFWPENLKSPRTWRQAGRDCEGIDRGPTVGYREICHNRDLTPEPGIPYVDPPEAD